MATVALGRINKVYPNGFHAVARVDPKAPVKPRERFTFAIDADGMQFFDPDTGAAIWA